MINDTPTSKVKKFKEDVVSTAIAMGYNVKLGTFDKKYLPPSWKYLAHIILQCLTDLKGGFDSMRLEWVGFMVCLITKEDMKLYQFIFNIICTLSRQTDKWGLYSHFFYLIFDYVIPEVPRQIYEVKVDEDG